MWSECSRVTKGAVSSKGQLAAIATLYVAMSVGLFIPSFKESLEHKDKDSMRKKLRNEKR